jgi:hypothetical protein
MRNLLPMVIFSLLLFFGGIVIPLSVEAEKMDNKQEIIHKFVLALLKKDERMLKTLVNPTVEIPEFRENTPFERIQGLPTDDKNSMVLLAHFKKEEETGIQRIAFIWEVTVQGDRISNIRVVSDAANPFMNEQVIFKEYREKFHKDILVPSHFPFTVTHVNGKITGNEVKLNYINLEIKGILQIRAVPHNENEIEIKDSGYAPVTLNNGIKGVLGKTPTGFELIFHHDAMQYNIKIHEVDGGSYKATKNDLIQVVDSIMLRMNMDN